MERKAARQRLANAARAERDLPHSGGPKVFGYEQDGVRVVPSEADAIRLAADQILSGVPALDDRPPLVGAGVRVSHGNSPPSQERLDGARREERLRQPRHAGILVWHGVEVGPGAWKPIIPLETHLALVALLTDSARTLGTVKTGRVPATLLTGIAVCEHCGETARGSSVRGALRYACPAARRFIPRDEVDA